MFRGWNQKVKSKGAIEREKKLMFGLVIDHNRLLMIHWLMAK
jgi:hypothetical protein